MKVEGSPQPTMGEKPIYSTRAHVFQIDPSTKKKWLPASSQSVSVSYYYDSIRNTYRIISVEGTKAIINSTLTANMVFTKTSQKFGQWSDPRANTVYGLGFGSEPDCARFVEKFKEVKEMLKKSGGGQEGATTASNNNNSSVRNSIGSNSSSAGEASPMREVESESTTTSTPPPPHTSLQHRPSTPNYSSPHQETGSRRNSGSSQTGGGKTTCLASNEERSLTGGGSVSGPIPLVGGSPLVDQLKYENDRLKIALAQSSANAKKWEVELQTLKNNNARLTTALQESTANVEEWKKQLSAYKEESARMKKKCYDLEKIGGSELLQRQVSEQREIIQDLETDQRRKEQQISALENTAENSKSFQNENQELQNRVKDLEREAEHSRQKEGDLKVQLTNARAELSGEKGRIRSVQEQLASKLKEATSLNQQLEKLVK